MDWIVKQGPAVLPAVNVSVDGAVPRAARRVDEP